jgi:hypothetical protein
MVSVTWLLELDEAYHGVGGQPPAFADVATVVAAAVVAAVAVSVPVALQANRVFM